MCFDEAERTRARVRSAARRAGGWRSRCGPCRSASPRSAHRWCCGGAGGQDHRRAWRARPAPARCSGTRSRRPRIRPSPKRSPRRLRRSASPRKASPATCWRHPAQHPQQGRPGIAGVHAVLAAGAGAGRSAQAAARAESAAPGAGPRERRARKLAPRAQRIPTGPAACARPGRRARSRRRPGSRRFWQAAWPAMPATATGPTAQRHLAAVAASALWRDQPAAGLARRAFCRGRTPCPVSRHRQVPERTGLARILPPSAVRRARSRRHAICSPPSTPFPGSATTRRCGPGSAAGPATPSSMPGCASSGTPA